MYCRNFFPTLTHGSDGIFDVFPQSEFLSEYALNRFKTYGQSDKVAHDIIDTCFARGSTDNMTILLVKLNPKDQIFDQTEMIKNDKLDQMIKQKVHDVLENVSLSQLNTPQATHSLMLKVFTEINDDMKVKELLPPGAQLSAKSFLIKEEFHQVMSAKAAK